MPDEHIDEEALERVKTFLFGSEEEVEQLCMRIGDKVKVLDQDISGEIIRWDGAKAVVLDDDRDDWMEEGDDGTLVFRVSGLRGGK
jgi:hypothetical protein